MMRNDLKRRLGYKLYNMDIKFVIIMSTFNRKNGKTPEYLTRSLDCILLQSYTNWDLIIVGDKYEPENELIDIINNYKTRINKNNIIYINNQNVERDVITHKPDLWCCAGANSMNIGLKYARENDYKYYCHLDDDDYWSSNHLQSLHFVYNKYPNCIFANTQSTHIGSILPNISTDIYENNVLPTPCGMIHSSFSFRIDIILNDYLSIFGNNFIHGYPADAAMLQTIKDFILQNNMYCSVYNPVLTCYHDIEGESQ
jgi:glycosyltransferase involved in cell wall biosynthesis